MLVRDDRYGIGSRIGHLDCRRVNYGIRRDYLGIDFRIDVGLVEEVWHGDYYGNLRLGRYRKHARRDHRYARRMRSRVGYSGRYPSLLGIRAY